MEIKEVISGYLKANYVLPKNASQLRKVIDSIKDVFSFEEEESLEMVRGWMNNNGLHEDSEQGKRLWYDYLRVKCTYVLHSQYFDVNDTHRAFMNAYIENSEIFHRALRIDPIYLGGA